SLEKTYDDQFIIFHGYTTSDFIFGIGRTIISPFGEVVYQTGFNKEDSHLYTGHPNTSYKLAGGGYLTAGSRSWFDDLASVTSLCKYNETGQLTWIQYYGDSI